MRYGLISFVSVLMAIVGWWGLYELTGRSGPDQPGMTSLFFALLFLALTTTLAPPISYLNRRFAPEALRHDPARFVRHSVWAGLCLTVWAWLQMQRVLNAGLALVTALILVALEYLIIRLRAETPDEPKPPPGASKRPPDQARQKPAGPGRKPDQAGQKTDAARQKPPAGARR